MLNHLGFFIPISIALGAGGLDERPGLGVCSKCLRANAKCYRYGSGSREAICRPCLADTVRVRGRRAVAHPRGVGKVTPSVRTDSSPDDEFTERREWWTKVLS